MRENFNSSLVSVRECKLWGGGRGVPLFSFRLLHETPSLAHVDSRAAADWILLNHTCFGAHVVRNPRARIFIPDLFYPS